MWQNVFSKFGHHQCVASNTLFFFAVFIKIQRLTLSCWNLAGLPMACNQMIMTWLQRLGQKRACNSPWLSWNSNSQNTLSHVLSTHILVQYCKKPNSQEATYRCSGWPSKLFQTFTWPKPRVKCQWRRYLENKSSRANCFSFQTFKYSRSKC